MSDTLMLEATGEGVDRLKALLSLDGTRRITGMVQKENALILNWEHEGGARVPFPPAVLADQIIAWLMNRDGKVVSNPNFLGAEYGKEPDIDGHCKKGWRIIVGSASDPITIKPQWMVYHK